MRVVNAIAWEPIADMPAELKDGRDVLLWNITPWGEGVARIGCWVEDQGSTDVYQRWEDDESREIDKPTHFAEINAPR